jgi:hypothetical protein
MRDGRRSTVAISITNRGAAGAVRSFNENPVFVLPAGAGAEEIS